MSTQTMRSGGTAHPEEIMNFLASRLIVGLGGVYDISGSSMLVEESDTPAMTVKVNTGQGFVKKVASEMGYPARVYSSAESVTITANSSGNSRIDAIVAYVDLTATPTATITNVLKLVAVAGTPAPSPVAPDSTAIEASVGASNPYIVLANVTVANGAVSILDANITDKREACQFELNQFLSDGQAENYQIDATASSDDLTVTLQNAEGNDPTESSPVRINIAETIYKVESALSVELDDADGDYFLWDTGKIQGNISQLFVYAIVSSGAIVLGVSPDPSKTLVGANYFDGSQTGSAGHTNIVCNDTVSDTDECRLIGRINVHQEDDNDWITPATELVVNFPIYETDWLDYDPVLTSNGSMGVTATTSDITQYKISRDKCVVSFFLVVTTSGSASTGIRVYLPAVAVTGLRDTTYAFDSVAFPNRAGFGTVLTGNQYIDCFLVSGINWNIGTAKEVGTNKVYQVA